MSIDLLSIIFLIFTLVSCFFFGKPSVLTLLIIPINFELNFQGYRLVRQYSIMEPADNQQKVQEHILRRYKLIEKVGSGSYGHVWKVVCKKTKQILALKKIFDAFRNVKDAQRTYRQISILKKLQTHPYLVQLKDVIKADNDRDIYLIFSYMQCDLFSVIRQSLLKQPHIRFITYQIAQSLHFLHSCHILHRDLKPANILINSDCTIKLCDFGLSRFMTTKTGEELNMTEFVATRWYRSPEILFGSREYREQTDLWSFGCIVGEMLAGRAMFSGKTIMDQIEKIFAFVGCPSSEDISSLQTLQPPETFDSSKIRKMPASYWFKDCSHQGMDLVYKLLKFNPRQRLTLPQVLEHPFVKDFSGTLHPQPTPKPIYCDINDNTRWTVNDYRQLVYRMICPEFELCPLIRSPTEKYRASVSIMSSKRNLEGGGNKENEDKQQQPQQKPPTLLKSSKSDWMSPRKIQKESHRIYKSRISLYNSPQLRSPNHSQVAEQQDEDDAEKRQNLVAIIRNDSRKRISVDRKSLRRKA